MAKVRFQMFIDADQKKALELLQRSINVPMAEIIRDAINRLVAEYRKKKFIPPGDTATDKLLAVAGVCEGGPRDLADAHDKYLYGTKKQ